MAIEKHGWQRAWGHRNACGVLMWNVMATICPACGLQDTARIDQCIIMMLSNFDGMPADRIHNMLKMFVQEPQPYDRSEEQLATMLSRLVAQNRLSVSGGMYRIVHLA